MFFVFFARSKALAFVSQLLLTVNNSRPCLAHLVDVWICKMMTFVTSGVVWEIRVSYGL